MHLKNWTYAGELVVLLYEDDSLVKVPKKTFDRAFGAIINATKDAVVRDFVV